MPITQDRMIDLLRTIETFDKKQEKFNLLLSDLETYNDDYQAALNITREKSLHTAENLLLAIDHLNRVIQTIRGLASEFKMPQEARDIFIREKTHFNLRHRANTINRKAQQRRRQLPLDEYISQREREQKEKDDADHLEFLAWEKANYPEKNLTPIETISETVKTRMEEIRIEAAIPPSLDDRAKSIIERDEREAKEGTALPP